MGLTDDEERRLMQIERGLLEQDPRLAANLSAIRATHRVISVVQWLLGFLTLIAGLLALKAGNAVAGTVLSTAGVIMMGLAAVSLMPS